MRLARAVKAEADGGFIVTMSGGMSAGARIPARASCASKVGPMPASTPMRSASSDEMLRCGCMGSSPGSLFTLGKRSGSVGPPERSGPGPIEPRKAR